MDILDSGLGGDKKGPIYSKALSLKNETRHGNAQKDCKLNATARVFGYISVDILFFSFRFPSPFTPVTWTFLRTTDLVASFVVADIWLAPIPQFLVFLRPSRRRGVIWVFPINLG